MAIKVTRIRNGGNDWGELFGEALGQYLVHRYNEVQQGKADKRMAEAGFAQYDPEVSQEDIDAKEQAYRNEQGLDISGMDVRDAVGKQKQLYDDWGTKIAKWEAMKNDPKNEAMVSKLAEQIAFGRGQQDSAHERANALRELGARHGVDMTGYTANDARTGAPAVGNGYLVTDADLGYDSKAQREALERAIRDERHNQYLRNFNQTDYLAQAEKEARHMLPAAREAYLERANNYATGMQEQRNAMIQKEQQGQLANGLLESGMPMAAIMVNAGVPMDEVLKYTNPKVVDLGGEHVIYRGAGNEPVSLPNSVSPNTAFTTQAGLAKEEARLKQNAALKNAELQLRSRRLDDDKNDGWNKLAANYYEILSGQDRDTLTDAQRTFADKYEEDMLQENADRAYGEVAHKLDAVMKSDSMSDWTSDEKKQALEAFFDKNQVPEEMRAALRERYFRDK